LDFNKFKIQYGWTKQAKDCYFIGCNCSKCTIHDVLGDKCKMKRVVLELVKTYGKPDEDDFEEDDFEEEIY